MPAPRSITWPLEPHTAVKHAILHTHLDAWLPILTSQHGRVVVLDGFAGPCQYAGGEPGSPLIALNAFLQHLSPQVRSKEATFYFIEQDRKRCERLRQVLATRTLPPTAQIHVECGKFNETVVAVLDQLETRNLRLAAQIRTTCASPSACGRRCLWRMCGNRGICVNLRGHVRGPVSESAPLALGRGWQAYSMGNKDGRADASRARKSCIPAALTAPPGR
jgi:hypothetical protein